MARFWDGQEDQSGTIRRDPAGTRGRRDDPGIIEEVWRASPDDTPGDRQRDPAGAQAARAAATAIRASEGGHRGHPGGRSTRAAETAAHSASHLGSPARGTPGTSYRGANRGAMCNGASGNWGSETPGVRATELRVWTGSAGRLVRSRCETGRGSAQASVL